LVKKSIKVKVKPQLREIKPPMEKITKLIEPTDESIVEPSRIVKHTKYQYSESNGLVNISITILQTMDGFEEKVESSVPIHFWSCSKTNGELVAAGKVWNLTKYYCYIKEAYDPPYKMLFDITYEGKDNQIELQIE
jgi:hypothetical protein